MLALTFGFLLLAYRSTAISVEVADTKIALTQAALKVEQASSALNSRITEIENLREGSQNFGFGPQIFREDTGDCAGLTGSEKQLCEAVQGLSEVRDEVEMARQDTVEAINKLNALGAE